MEASPTTTETVIDPPATKETVIDPFQRLVPVETEKLARDCGRDPLDIRYDPIGDVVLVNGVRYSGDFFRFFRTAERGTLCRLMNRREDGSVDVHVYERGKTVYA